MDRTRRKKCKTRVLQIFKFDIYFLMDYVVSSRTHDSNVREPGLELTNSTVYSLS